MNQNVTIKALAKHAGVSPTTVSYVLNNKPGVKPETKERVLRAAEELNYVPNALAQSFRNKKSQTILVATCEALDEYGVFTQELVGTVLAARKHKYDVLVKSYLNYEKRYLQEIFQAAVGKRADAVVLIGGQFEPLLEWFLERDIKVVLLSGFTDLNVPSVNINSDVWSYKITKYLLKKGHTNLVYITYHLADREECNRQRGFCRALEEYHINPEGRTFLCESENMEELNTLTGRILKEMHPTGIVCWNDVMAAKVIDYCRGKGLAVPHDVAVTGFDDLNSDMFQSYGLTTVHQPFMELGKKAVEVLFELMDGKELPEREITLDCHMVIRNTA